MLLYFITWWVKLLVRANALTHPTGWVSRINPTPSPNLNEVQALSHAGERKVERRRFLMSAHAGIKNFYYLLWVMRTV
jgi:hypothetical protein